MPAPLRLYNTLSRTIEPVDPIEPGQLRIYVCGMTVYDHCHVGHARAMIVYDTLVRYLRHRGWTVTFVRNFTDIDDKIIQRAAAEGTTPEEVAERFIDSFHRDMDGLGLVRPDMEPRVSGTIDEIVAMIGRILDAGHAYVNQGTVWFDVASYPEYGALSGQRPDELRSDDPDKGKRHSADFALWKAARPDEPSWPSPWGSGRPGWHIECSAMCAATLGQEIDIHGGGLDLVFPHHENEIAQSQCSHGGQRFVRHWMHNGLLTAGAGTKAGGRAHRDAEAEQVDQKMGKSKNNAFVIHQALELVPAEAIRLYYLQTHYRSPLPWSDDSLLESLAMLARLYEAREQAEQMGGSEPLPKVVEAIGAEARTVVELARALPERIDRAMDEDFNTAMALGHAFELARAINRLGNQKQARRRGGPIAAEALAALSYLGPTLGLLQQGTEAFHDEVATKRLAALGLSREAVQSLVDDRQHARQQKDWAKADALRGQLEQMNISLMDTPKGPVWRVKL
ncbi:MAG: cysteine--tRNA ligase [Deltaproteobacteria bacterium]|nr:MAG: cysteine--tRNA ligase [Deltaproteobacteria bacterium]